MITNSKDLTKQAATSPRHRTGGYAILSRMTDKARADIAGTMGDYHTDCPLDHMLPDWKGVGYSGVRQALEAGATDDEIAKQRRHSIRAMNSKSNHADRAAGCIVGAFVGDALGLGPHWYYDLDELRRDFGPWIVGYTAPRSGAKYHAGMKAEKSRRP